jgi:1,3,6,8-tetrahydroxynaphthalene synthase
MEQTIELGRTRYPDHPRLDVALRLIRGTGIRKRHLVQPIEQTLRHLGFEARNSVYRAQAERRLPPVIDQALRNASLRPGDIDATIFVSCTGFLMPSLTAWLINELGFRTDMRQIPIAQLGCAAGGTAIGLARDFCAAHPLANVLIVSCEFCSLCYQPDDRHLGSLLSASLFGDAVAAAVVRGTDGTGPLLERSGSHLIPGTQSWISYDVKDTGFHFQLDKRVPNTLAPALGPVLGEFVAADGGDVANLDFYIVHAGGPRILDNLSDYFGLDPTRFRHSYATIRDYGNIASAVVLDSLHRLFEYGPPGVGAKGMIVGFGPGITAEFTLATWTSEQGPGPAERAEIAAASAADVLTWPSIPTP